jgi:hypothetical protein
MGPGTQFQELALVGLVFFNKTTELRIVGDQILFDLLLIRHAHPPSLLEGSGLILRSPYHMEGTDSTVGREELAAGSGQQVAGSA